MEYNIPYMSVSSNSLIILLKSMPLLFFPSLFCAIEKVVLKTPTIIVDLPISPCHYVNCFMYFETIILAAYEFVIILFYWWIEYFILKMSLTLFLLIPVALVYSVLISYFSFNTYIFLHSTFYVFMFLPSTDLSISLYLICISFKKQICRFFLTIILFFLLIGVSGSNTFNVIVITILFVINIILNMFIFYTYVLFSFCFLFSCMARLVYIIPFCSLFIWNLYV